jgi:hypothetical protein
MKIYKLTNKTVNTGFAILRPSNKQSVKKVDCLDVWWDDWGSSGDEIGDFVFFFLIEVCKRHILEKLQENFIELNAVPLRYNKTDKELTAKNPKRLKWLPKEEIPLMAFFSPKEFDCLPQSTVSTNARGMITFEGVAELRGSLIVPREQGKGLFFSSKIVSNYDFFTLTNSGHLLCTERVKEFCITNNYENVVFLEVGDILFE